MSQGGVLSNGGGGGGDIQTILGDTGSITGTTVTIFADNASINSGASVLFTNSGTVSTLNVTDNATNTFIGQQCGFLPNDASQCTGLGFQCLSSVTDDSQHVGIGRGALQNANDGQQNTACGAYSLNAMVSGGLNTAVGSQTAINLPSGNFNNFFGVQTGSAYTGSESSNILIQNAGVVGESNVMRLGTTGGDPLTVGSTFIAAINGVAVSNPRIVGINSSTEQMGTVALSVNTQVFITPGSFTYSASPGLIYAFVQVLGGGGGGGGSTNSGTVDAIAGSGGGGGGYTEAFISNVDIGLSQPVVVGAGGVGVSTNDGTDGGSSSFGTLLLGNPGDGGVLGTAAAGFIAGGGGGGFAGTSAAYGYSGQNGGTSGPPSGPMIADLPPYTYTGYGGSCFTGRQAEGYAWAPVTGVVSVPGQDQTEYGVGGPGGFSSNGGGPTRGGNAMSGFVIVTEYILA